KVSGEVEVQGRAGLLFPLGQTSLYTACLLLFLQIHQDRSASPPEVAHQGSRVSALWCCWNWVTRRRRRSDPTGPLNVKTTKNSFNAAAAYSVSRLCDGQTADRESKMAPLEGGQLSHIRRRAQ
ncbi:hypothetical protein GBF38_002525, partial [Nibea albiflora]